MDVFGVVVEAWRRVVERGEPRWVVRRECRCLCSAGRGRMFIVIDVWWVLLIGLLIYCNGLNWRGFRTREDTAAADRLVLWELHEPPFNVPDAESKIVIVIIIYCIGH